MPIKNPVNPKVDIAFKKIFGVEENKDLLIDLINAIVSEEDQVAGITLLNPYNPKNFKKDKLSVLDIKAEACDGRLFNIEIQVADEKDYDKRALYYWSKLYSSQLLESGLYSSLSKAIGIHILNFMSIVETDKYHNVFHITEKEEGFQNFTDFELHTIELNKFTPGQSKEINELVSNIKSSLDMWVAFLTRQDLLNQDSLPKELDRPNLKKAINVLNVMNFTAEEREAYENHLKWLRMEASALEKRGLSAMEVGLKEGEKIGLEKGKAEGEKKAKIETTKNLLKSGVDVEIISSSTGLSVSEIESLVTK